MHAGQLRHFPRADNQRFFPCQRSKYLLGQFYRGKTHRHRVGGNTGFRSDPFGRTKCPMHQAVEYKACRVFRQRPAVGVLHLSQNLCFTHDQRIEAGGDPKQMSDSVFISIRIKAGCLMSGQGTISDQNRFQHIHHLRIIISGSHELHPVTGGKMKDFVNALNRLQPGREVCFPAAPGKEFFKHVDRRRFII